jgi:antitoxin (DNA-binding transcriptional repressor) of toxin-antitoxin stability system
MLAAMAEAPEGDFVEHPDEVLRRIKAGEAMTLTVDGEPIADVVLRRRRGSVSWEEFQTWPKADPGMLRVLRDIRGEPRDWDWQDPWERWGAEQ